MLPSAHSNKVIVPAIPMITNSWPHTSSVMKCLEVPQLTPDNYTINYLCYFVCDSQQNLVKTNFIVVDVDATDFTISSLKPGSSCQVNVTATFGNDSNMITIPQLTPYQQVYINI